MKTDNFVQKALELCKTFKVKSLKTPKLDVPRKITAYKLLYKDKQEKKELTDATVSQASAVISREWEKVKANDKKMKKYSDLHKAEKQYCEEGLQRYQDYHPTVKV